MCSSDLKKVAKLGQEKHNVLVEKVAEYVTKQLKSLDETQGKNLREFMKDLPGEIRVSCWSKLTSNGSENLVLSKQVHKYCVDTILDVFGVSSDAATKAMAAASQKKGKK